MCRIDVYVGHIEIIQSVLKNPSLLIIAAIEISVKKNFSEKESEDIIIIMYTYLTFMSC